MEHWSRAGDVLRWWRSDVAGLTQQEAANRLNVQPSSLSNWERGTRAVSLDLDEVDRSLDGHGTLAGLLWAHGTTTGLDPGYVWTKVFPGPSQPVWLWVRSTASRVHLEAEWGIVRLDTDLELGPNGAFITVGASIADSPVVVAFDELSWADFGFGEVPDAVSGAPVIPAVTLFEASTADGEFMEYFRSELATRLRRESDDVIRWAKRVPRAVATFFPGADGDRDGDAEGEPQRWRIHPDGITAVERVRFARLRHARRLSLNDVSRRLRTLTGVDASRDTLRRFETDVGRPHDPMLPVALDHVLGAEGRLTIHQLLARSGNGTVTFPPFWRGPVWLELGGGAPSTVRLERGRWTRDVTVDGPTVCAIHWFDPEVPLRVTAEADLAWSAGVGRRAGSVAIDQNWKPIDVDVAARSLSEVTEAISAAVERIEPEPD